MGTILPEMNDCYCKGPGYVCSHECAVKDIPARQPFDDVPELPALKVQIGGSHYTDMAIQPMTYSMANGLDACQHTIIKYVSRFRDKNGIEDLEKAKHCIDLLIEFEKGKQP